MIGRLRVVKMLKKRLGIEAIESDWSLYRYFKIPSTLIIPEGCEKITNWAFYDCSWLEKVVISGSVKVIGDCAFNKCKNATIILRKPRRKFKKIAKNTFYSVRDVKEEVGN